MPHICVFLVLLIQCDCEVINGPDLAQCFAYLAAHSVMIVSLLSKVMGYKLCHYLYPIYS